MPADGTAAPPSMRVLTPPEPDGGDSGAHMHSTWWWMGRGCRWGSLQIRTRRRRQGAQIAIRRGSSRPALGRRAAECTGWPRNCRWCDRCRMHREADLRDAGRAAPVAAVDLLVRARTTGRLGRQLPKPAGAGGAGAGMVSSVELLLEHPRRPRLQKAGEKRLARRGPGRAGAGWSWRSLK